MVLLPSQGNTTTIFQPINIGPGLLGAFFASRAGLGGGGLSPAQIIAARQEPAPVPPWRLAQQEASLERRLGQVRGLDKFIDLESATARRAGNDVDSRATFALFEALTAMQTLAQVAAETATPQSRLASLDELFRQGLGEVQTFLATANLNKLDLLFGAKENNVDATLDIAKDQTGYSGVVFHRGNRDEAIAGLTGTESFTVSITKSGVTDDIQVDLSTIAAPLTVDNLVDHINTQIAALTITDGAGEQVPKHLSRFKVTGSNADGFRLELEGTLTESVKLTETTPAPALYLTAGVTPITSDGPAVGRLVKLNELGGLDPGISVRQDIAASDLDQQALNDAINTDDEDADGAVTVETRAGAVATDADGFVYVVGTTPGDIDGQRGDGADDVFLTKYDSNGEVVFSRLLAANGTAEGLAIATDNAGNVVIAGQVDGKVADGDALSGQDSFVVKFDSRGNEMFRFQLDSVASDSALGLATNAAGDIIVSGEVAGTARAGLSASGGRDAYVLRLDGTTGALADITQFGTAGSDQARAVTVAGDGAVLVAAVEDGRAVVRKLDGANLSNELDRIDLGDLGGGSINAIDVATVNGNEQVIVAGTSFNGGIGGSQLNSLTGSSDGFVATLDNGAGGLSAGYTRYLGTTAADSVQGLAVDGDKVYVAGRTAEALAGQSRQGAVDSFVSRLDLASGAVEFEKQFGSFGARQETTGIALAQQGGGVLDVLGLRAGDLAQNQAKDLVTRTGVNDGDFFYVSIDGRRPTKISIGEGDTLDRLAARINAVSFRGIEATVTSGSADQKLEIKAVDGSRIDLIAGDAGRDALSRLGLEPATIMATELLFDLESNRNLTAQEAAQNLGGVFGLDLDDNFHLRDKATAKFVLGKIESAISTVQRAFRSLRFDAFAFELTQQNRFAGAVPAQLSKELANYQGALLRLQAGSLNSSGGFF
ncbi:MAG: hypothetical protein Tsb0016_18990 [Sphingomonadales bacterium]